MLIPLIWLAFLLRVWDLSNLPPGLWYDEAYYAMDAAWLLDGGAWQLFFAGNNGREPVFIYGQAVMVWLFGATTFAARLQAPLWGVLTIPVMYVLARRLTRAAGWSGWVPYLATAGLVGSFWHLTLSRSGYRGILLPLATMLVLYAFWRGWHTRSFIWMALAGVALGISQYTYLAARLLPLIFVLLAFTWTLLHWRDVARLRFLWVSLVVMAVVSAGVFAPLGWIFWQHPDLFSARTGDVMFTPDTPADLAAHLLDAGSLFFNGSDPNWRHHLPGRPILGWLTWLPFWAGLAVCLWRIRRQETSLLLVTMLAVLYLPAFIAVPPVHALRLSNLLPVYYLLSAVGLTLLRPPRVLLIGAALLLTVETGLTSYDYFYRWANHEEPYVQYNGPLVDFVAEVRTEAARQPVLIPFHVYIHPTTRYLLRDHFSEQPPPPSLGGPVKLVTLPDNFRLLNVANIPALPSFVWLEGETVYVSRPPREAEQRYLDYQLNQPPADSYTDRFGRELAFARTLTDVTPLLPMFTETEPQYSASLQWADEAQLRGYDISPNPATPGQPLTLNLYWRSLTDLTFEWRLFVQILNAGGDPIGQWEGDAFREDMYRWRPDGLLATQHTLWLGPETPNGLYVLRLGFFKEPSGARLPVSRITSDGLVPLGDQVHAGIFSVGESDPPTIPLEATFGEAIRLDGITPGRESDSVLPVTFYWTAAQPIAQPYTVFLQLLDESGAVVAGWDSQPLGGLYPTTMWSPGDSIRDTFRLPLPADGLTTGTYRLITGFYHVETGQRLHTEAGADYILLMEVAR